MDETFKQVMKNQNKSNKLKKEACKIIMKQIQNKILYQSNVGNVMCIYSIPNIIIGLPKYNTQEIKKEIILILLNENFIVKDLFNTDILICWKKEEIMQNIKEKNENTKNINVNKLNSIYKTIHY